MDAFRLEDDEIEKRAADGSHGRGVEYHENGAVLSAIARGDEVRAQVAGSKAHPYAVGLVAEGDRLIEASCSCPDDRDGWCKHVVAVLRSVRGGDEELERRAPIDEEVEDLAGHELQAFVADLARARPEVRDLLDARWETVRVLQADDPGDVDLDPGPFRRWVRMLLHGGRAGTGHTHERATRTKEGIDELLRSTDRLTDEGAPRAAAVALGAMTDAYLEGWEVLHGLGRFPTDVVETLVDRLEAVLGRTELSDEERDRWLTRLDDWQTGVDGYGLAGVFLPVRHAVQVEAQSPDA